MAFVFNVIENTWLFGRLSWTPDLLAIVLVFWNIQQPQRIGLGIAFVFGLMLDVQQTSLLGQHALCYTLLSFAATSLHRRILWFTTPVQALQLLPLFFTAHLLQLLLRLAFTPISLDWGLLVAPLLEALLWPLANIILLAPQRRAPEPDATRPL